MPGRSAGFTSSLLAVAMLGAPTASVAADAPVLVKPLNGSWIPGGELEVIAKAAAGRLLLDGRPLESEEVFPGVFLARMDVEAGEHSLRVESAGGSQEIRFRSGAAEGGEDATPFADHPPVQVECTHCHSVSRRGRFRFSGGCQSCHGEERFIRTHSHQSHELASCGMCHDAHGSSVPNLLALPREQACKQCHN